MKKAKTISGFLAIIIAAALLPRICEATVPFSPVVTKGGGKVIDLSVTPTTVKVGSPVTIQVAVRNLCYPYYALYPWPTFSLKITVWRRLDGYWWFGWWQEVHTYDSIPLRSWEQITQNYPYTADKEGRYRAIVTLYEFAGRKIGQKEVLFKAE